MFGFLGDVASVIMTPLYYLVSGVLLAWREIYAVVLSDNSGWTWALAIIGLTVTVRVLLIPLYLREVRAQRAMRELGPQIKELQQRYKHDRERLLKEQMKLWKETGTNPFASLLPLIVQALVLFALFRVIDTAAKFAPATDGAFRRGFITDDEAQSLSQAKILGARIADTFLDSSHAGAKVLALVLALVMCVSQIVTQRQQMAAMPVDAMSGEYAKQQRLLLYTLPVVFALGGVAFPLGVLVFWATSNAWTVGQHTYFHRDDPGPDPTPVP